MKPSKRITNADTIEIDVTFETPRPGYASCHLLRRRKLNTPIAYVPITTGGGRRAEYLAESPAAVLDLVQVLRYARKQFERFKHGHGAARFHAWNMLDEALTTYTALETAIKKDTE